MNFLNNITGNNMQTNDGGMQLNNVEILYTKVQRIYIKPEHKEERQRDLRINVEIHAGISPVCRKSLCVRLSDDDDSCFLYSLLINDDDFKNLKADQNLLVDFDNFATQLISLLEQCHVPLSSCSSKSPPKFLLELYEERGEWFCRFVEPKTIKNLCHLYLKISPASDDDIKTHMAVKIKQLIENINNKNRDLVKMEEKLNMVVDDLENKTRSFKQLEEKFYNEKYQLQKITSDQLAKEKDSHNQAKIEWEETSKYEIKELKRRHSEEIKQLNFKIDELTGQNMAYRDKQLHLETTNTDQSNKIQNLEEKLNLTERDLSQLQKQNSELNIDYRSRDQTVNTLTTTVAVLEQQLKDKDILIIKHEEMIKANKEQITQLKITLQDKDNQLQRKEKSIQSIGDDLRKANDSLQKYQDKIESLEAKLKRRAQTCEEQQKLLNTKQKEITQLSTKNDDYEKEMKELKIEIHTQKSEIKNLGLKISEQDKKLNENDNIIGYLRRQLSDYNSPINQQNAMPINVPPTFQLSLPRSSKFLTNKFDQINNIKSALTSAVSTTTSTPHYTGGLGTGFALRNPNINHTSKNSTARSTGVPDNSPSLATFSRSGQITSTSTPIERMHILKKMPNPGSSEIGNVNNENNNVQISAGTNGKLKSGALLQGGLSRRTVFDKDKPLLPSTYFPKQMH